MPAQRHKLLGTYRTPPFKYGDVVHCELRGFVHIVAVSAGRIPWPKCRSGTAHAIILYGALADAVRRESAEAVMYWFGVGSDRVWKWRKALRVPKYNEGTLALMRRNGVNISKLPHVKKAWARTLRSPERAAKIAAARRGQKRPAWVMAFAHEANRGRRVTAETRRKMRRAHKRRLAMTRKDLSPREES